MNQKVNLPDNLNLDLSKLTLFECVHEKEHKVIDLVDNRVEIYEPNILKIRNQLDDHANILNKYKSLFTYQSNCVNYKKVNKKISNFVESQSHNIPEILNSDNYKTSLKTKIDELQNEINMAEEKIVEILNFDFESLREILPIISSKISDINILMEKFYSLKSEYENCKEYFKENFVQVSNLHKQKKFYLQVLNYIKKLKEMKKCLENIDKIQNDQRFSLLGEVSNKMDRLLTELLSTNIKHLVKIKYDETKSRIVNIMMKKIVYESKKFILKDFSVQEPTFLKENIYIFDYMNDESILNCFNLATDIVEEIDSDFNLSDDYLLKFDGKYSNAIREYMEKIQLAIERVQKIITFSTDNNFISQQFWDSKSIAFYNYIGQKLFNICDDLNFNMSNCLDIIQSIEEVKIFTENVSKLIENDEKRVNLSRLIEECDNLKNSNILEFYRLSRTHLINYLRFDDFSLIKKTDTIDDSLDIICGYKNNQNKDINAITLCNVPYPLTKSLVELIKIFSIVIQLKIHTNDKEFCHNILYLFDRYYNNINELVNLEKKFDRPSHQLILNRNLNTASKIIEITMSRFEFDEDLKRLSKITNEKICELAKDLWNRSMSTMTNLISSQIIILDFKPPIPSKSAVNMLNMLEKALTMISSNLLDTDDRNTYLSTLLTNLMNILMEHCLKTIKNNENIERNDISKDLAAIFSYLSERINNKEVFDDNKCFDLFTRALIS
ncbi:MAG: hypothetical protein MHMPM18_000380 [Marteilia pararefringens]